MFAALLTGEVKMSAERRITIWIYVPGNRNEDNIEVKEKMQQLIDIAVEGEGLENLRCKMEMIDVFRTFVSYCLIHFTTSINWRYKACNTCISEIFTESDEALCILLIENNADDYAKMYHEQRKIGRKEARPKYTKVECMDKKFKGWDRKGIRKFNSLVAAIKKNRELSTSKEMEMQIKSKYVELSGKGVDKDDEESDENNDELDDINGYDGFAGITEDEVATNDEITGATNLTPV